MRLNAPRHQLCSGVSGKIIAMPIVFVCSLLFSLFGVNPSGVAGQADPGFSPASGPAQVIAQGVVALPEGGAVWRTVRTSVVVEARASSHED